jgi:broad specificity phosphatase PhoE
MRLYFIRHGESSANLAGEFSNSGLKHPLTDKGVQQARLVADTFSGLSVEKIYSSPVMRAVQSAQIISERLLSPLEISEALREWSVGIYEGTTDPAGWELHRQVQEDWFYNHRLDSKMPGGESFCEIRDRFVPFIEGLLRYAEDELNRNIILVGHGGLYLAMLPEIFRNVDFDFAQQHGFSYAGYVEAESQPDGLYCISWCGFSLRVKH